MSFVDERELTLSDEEILARYRQGRCLSKTEHPYADNRIIYITDTTVAKVSQDIDEDISEPSEAVVLDILAQHTSIPVPRVRRVIKREWDILIVMDYIQARQLSTVWPTMSSTEKAQVAETLRDYVRQLRLVDIPRKKIPGPLASGDDSVARSCESPPVFGQVISTRGPFASYADLEAFFNSRREKVLQAAAMKPPRSWLPAVRPEDVPPFDATYPLVLTHQDLNPRNLILGDDNRLWVVDWSWAGFYPEWWEAIAMDSQADNEQMLTRVKDESWREIIPIVCGKYDQVAAWLHHIGPALSWT